jgi:citronellol/citronellal dehydrogenase
MAKFGMSLCVLGMAGEFKGQIAFNALWPRSTIATAAIQNLLGGPQAMKGSRKPEIMGDAAHVIFNRPAKDCTGNFFIDDEVMKSAGITDLSSYAVDPSAQLLPDFFV